MKNNKDYEVTYRKSYKDYPVDQDDVEYCSYEEVLEMIDDQADGGIEIYSVKAINPLTQKPFVF